MASTTQTSHQAAAAIAAEEPVACPPVPPETYDRSSLQGDYMVMLDGQTEADYYRHAPPTRMCEYIDGIVYMPSPARFEHQEIVQLLLGLFLNLNPTLQFGRVQTGPAVMRIGTGRSFEPDLLVLPAEAPDPVSDRNVVHEPKLVVEVLSPSTRSHDLELKAKCYREAAIPEIWFIDLENGVLLAERRQQDGKYHGERHQQGPCRSTALPGFWVDVSWLWTRPLPDVPTCTQAILAGPPA